MNRETELAEVPYTIEQIEEKLKCDRANLPLTIFEASTLDVTSNEECDDSPWNRYKLYPNGGDLAHLTMRLAEVAHIVTAPHTMVRLTDGTPIFASQRVDLNNQGEALPMEDLCQISELTFEERYEGSYEQVMELIEECSSVNKIDVITLWEHITFAWICGNSDFNLKDIALYEPYNGICSLAPLRFMNPVALHEPEKLGQLALILNGKKVKIQRTDLEVAMKRSGLKNRAINIIFKKFVAARDTWFNLIDESPLSTELKESYKKLLDKQLKAIDVVGESK